MDDNERWICVDPGETTGWSIWKGKRLLGGAQTPMWPFAHDLWDAIHDNIGPLAEGDGEHLRPGVGVKDNVGPIGLVVCEKFALYPWAMKDMAWDELRTVQLIGAIRFTCDLHQVNLHKQPATIKERALAGGAKELFTRPLHENRHHNDSVMHGFFYYQVEIEGVNLKLADGKKK